MNTLQRYPTSIDYTLALSSLQGIGNVSLKKILTHFGNSKTAWNNLQRDKGIKNKQKRYDHTTYGINLLAFEDEAYPERLRHINDPPSLLYTSSQLPLNHPRVVGIVGTRTPSIYGQESTQHLVKELAPYHPVIVSGFAKGIDIAAHQAAIEHGLPTVGVIAGGLDCIYPKSHTQYTLSMLASGGGLVTESKCGTIPESFLFPDRNVF